MFASVSFSKPCLSGSDAEHKSLKLKQIYSPVTPIIDVLQQHAD